MRPKTVLTTTVVLLFLSSAASSADELSDLKSQVQKLEKKIEKLEQQQQEQAKEVEKVPEIEASVEEMQTQPTASEVVSKALGARTNIGGHLKFFLADQTFGEVNGEDQHDSFAMGVNDLWLYFNKTLTSWLNLTVAPQIVVVAEATPVLGSNITRSSSASVDIDLDEAYMTIRLPERYELKVGAFYPMFSEEYATKSWWHEQYHNNNGLVTLEAWQSFGLELYRAYEFESFSLPISLSVINGEDRGISQPTRFTDNNNSVNGLLHIAPEWLMFNGRMRLLGSAGWGRWDDAGDNGSFEWAAGAEYTHGSVSISGEYMSRESDNLPLPGGGTEDGTDKGWYLKAKYSLSPKWRFVVKYSDVELWSVSTNSLLTDQYKALSLAVGWWITESSTIIPQIEYVDADRQGTGQTLEYIRYTLGWRTTF